MPHRVAFSFACSVHIHSASVAFAMRKPISSSQLIGVGQGRDNSGYEEDADDRQQSR